jgi:hypothetical protein
MGEQHSIAEDLVADRASATTDPVTNLTTSKTFTAEIDGAPDPVRVMTEIGEDAREVTLLHVAADAEAEAISPGDIVQFKLFGVLTQHTVLKRNNSPGEPQTDFWVQKIAPQDS